MMRGVWGWSCAVTLVASHAIAGDPKTECIAAADQAQQARDDGRYHAARDGFTACSQSACPKMVAESCAKWLRETQEAMPTVVLSAKDEQGNDRSDVRVKVDGNSLVTSLDGKPVEVDPGSHHFRFEASGAKSHEVTVVIRAGEKLRAVSATLEPLAIVHKTPEPEPVHPSDGMTGRNVMTVALGVLGAGGLAGGVAMGFGSQSDADTAAKLRSGMPANACTGAGASTVPCQQLAQAVDAQNRDAAVSVAMYVVGGAFAAAAIITFMVWPKKSATEAPISWLVGPGVLGVRGHFQ